jgi:hypothetical protein
MSRLAKIINVYKTFVGKPDGKKPLGRPRRRWEENTRIDLREIVQEGADWMQGLVVGSCEHGNEPSGSMKGGEFLD